MWLLTYKATNLYPTGTDRNTKSMFIDDSIQIATLVKPFRPDDDFETTLFNANSPKVVLNKKNEAMYFSRSIIPYMRGRKYTEWLPNHTYYKHIGLYAYRADTLKEITHLPQSPLELAESWNNCAG